MVTLHIPPSAVVRFRLSRAELEEMAFLAALAASDRERVSRLRELLDSRPAEAALGRHAGRSGTAPDCQAPGVRSQGGHQPQGRSSAVSFVTSGPALG